MFHQVSKVFAGYYNVALVTSKGQLLMHGCNNVNQLCCQPDVAMHVEFFPEFKPIDGFPKGSAVFDLSIGESHVYALVRNESGQTRVYGWGKNFHGQLFAAKDGESFDVPTDLTTHFEQALQKDEIIIQASVGSQHSLFLTSQNRVLGIGHSGFGQLGPTEAGSKIQSKLKEIFINKDEQLKVKRIFAGRANSLAQVQQVAKC